jgi:hypothetical protein
MRLVTNYLFKQNLPIPHTFLISAQQPKNLNVLDEELSTTLSSNHPFVRLKHLLHCFNLVILPADKTGVLIILPENILTAELAIHLEDKHTYQILTFDELQHYVNIQTDAVSDAIKFYNKPTLRVENPSNRYIYFLPKVHKQLSDWRSFLHPKMRPIVSDTNSTTNNLAKHLLPYLQSVERQFITAVPSSLAVVDNIISLNSNQLITRNTQLVTMDIEALFTRIPQDRLLDIVNHQITEQLSNAELKDKFMYYLRTIINNNTFQVNDSYCLQKIGLPMGGPLSGTLANIYLGFMETRVMNFPKVLLYNRFMDDILVVCNFSDKEMNQFIQTLHSTINLKIIASFNKESVNFLDLSIFLSLRKRLLFIQPFSKRPHCFPVPSILGSRGAKSDVNIIKSQVLRVYRQTTDSRSFSLAVNKYLGFILSKAHRHIRKAIFQFLLPLKISTHKWTVEIPLCGECKGISNLNGISVVKILKIGTNYVAIKEP